MTQSLLHIESVQLQIAEQRLCDSLTFSIQARESWGLLGRNGAGKTTLLHSLLGLHKPVSGTIKIADQSLAQFSRRELAQHVGILLQEGIDSLPATVLETVMLGRHPHSQSILSESAADQEIAQAALQEFQLGEMAARAIDTLSGGERQRLALAMLITQAPALYLLDEPSNHLDVAFQTRLLSTLQARIHAQGAGMLMATHDINLAARYCDHIVLLLPNGKSIVGAGAEVLNEENLSKAYECQIKSVSEGQLTLFYPA